MPIEVLMPALSPTMLDGKLLGWMKNEGDNVDTSTVIAEIETDKAVMELEAPSKGVLSRIIIKDVQKQIPVGTLIAVIAKKNETEQDVEDFIKNFNQNTTSSDVNQNENQIADIKLEHTESEIQTKQDNSMLLNCNEKIKASPLAKKIASENNIDLKNISVGSGPLGRIIKEDIENFLNSNSNKNPSSSAGIFANCNNRISKEFNEIAVSPMRKAIATRLTQSKQQIPHFYVSFDVKMDKLLQTREELNEILSVHIENDKPKYKISINDMITKAAALAIEKNQKINSIWQGDKIIQYNNIDICIAVALENGLITPIVKNCNKKGIVTISEEIKDLAKKAKEGRLKNEEFQGGGFTISNLGSHSHISSFTAIINPPQVAILSIAAVQEKVLIKDGKIDIVKVCQMQISADHRALDGADIAKFTGDIKDIIENKVLSLIL